MAMEATASSPSIELPVSSHVNTQAMVGGRAVFRIVSVAYALSSSNHYIVVMGTHICQKSPYLYLYIDYHNVLDSGKPKLQAMARFLRRLDKIDASKSAMKMFRTLISYGGQTRNEQTHKNTLHQFCEFICKHNGYYCTAIYHIDGCFWRYIWSCHGLSRDGWSRSFRRPYRRPYINCCRLAYRMDWRNYLRIHY